MATKPIVDEDYGSSSEEDSNFAPDEAPERDSSGETDDEDGGAGPGTTGKRKQAGEGIADDAGFENSGDEAVIGRAKKRRRKAKDGNGHGDDDDGGEGGLIKTRSQRAQE